MMGQQPRSEPLLYYFRLEDQIPDDHFLKRDRNPHGSRGEFIIDVDWSSFGDVADPGVWSQVHDEGVQVLENIANICVPVIAAIEGAPMCTQTTRYLPV